MPTPRAFGLLAHIDHYRAAMLPFMEKYDDVLRAGNSSEELPIGLQIVARPRREDVALAVAGHVERAMGGWQAPML
jgi:Asp-tRNA(Asn)/Glu-tRNA(Gln) amidotransferase A subunit family amidase